MQCLAWSQIFDLRDYDQGLLLVDDDKTGARYSVNVERVSDRDGLLVITTGAFELVGCSELANPAWKPPAKYQVLLRRKVYREGATIRVITQEGPTIFLYPMLYRGPSTIKTSPPCTAANVAESLAEIMAVS